MGPARPSAKLDQTHDQLGHPLSWIERAISSAMADGRTGTIVLFSSYPQCSSPKTVSNSLLFRIDRSCHWILIIRTVRTRLPE
ncbi:hypothetical protein F2Q68_00039103 [Brassica cretica]|uniref:Uncharacterized protein n=1 Tax=Brassica cretica TaxID=69181 RepID=A0A8S9MDP6_BRACR|nr:hypothetical protein F2Q68_00039103 [Brassica cretica]